MSTTNNIVAISPCGQYAIAQWGARWACLCWDGARHKWASSGTSEPTREAASTHIGWGKGVYHNA